MQRRDVVADIAVAVVRLVGLSQAMPPPIFRNRESDGYAAGSHPERSDCRKGKFGHMLHSQLAKLATLATKFHEMDPYYIIASCNLYG